MPSCRARHDDMAVGVIRLVHSSAVRTRGDPLCVLRDA